MCCGTAAMAQTVHPWETNHVWDDWNADSDDECLTQVEQASRAFIELLLSMYMCSAITAGNFCMLCYWAAKAGMPGDVNVFGIAPGRQSGQYQKHLNTVLLFDQERKHMYKFSAPGMKKSEVSRTSVKFDTVPGHESIGKDFDDPAYETKLREAIHSKSLPLSYYNHPVVTANPTELVAPFSLYMDGLPYSLVDSVLAV